jgi:hypothetical protein
MEGKMEETRDKYAKTRETAQRVLAKRREEREVEAKKRAMDNSPFTDEEIRTAERAIDRRVRAARTPKSQEE